MKNKTKSFPVSNLGLLVIALFWFAATAHAQLVQTPRQKSAAKSIPDGYSIIDGDIQMPTEVVNAILSGKKKLSDVSDATYRTNLWINGIVPFEFDANVVANPAWQSAMISAMAVLENAANVHFQQCPDNECSVLLFGWVHIQNSTGNNSPVGRIGLEQTINIVSWNSQYTIVHELLHTLGFYHEQSRADRGTYIQVNCNNVQGGCGGTIFNNNFVIEADATAYGYYDFDSVMHYGQCAFTNGGNCPTDGTQTITVLPPNQNQQTLIGQLTHLSALDRATVSFLYPYDGWVFYDCTSFGFGQNGTFLRPYNDPIFALNATPPGGTLWVLKNCSFPVRVYNQQVTVKAAPGVTATFGN